MINQERLKNLLIELIKIDSLSRQEFDVAMRLKREMEELGATVWIDDAGESWVGSGQPVNDPTKTTVRVAFSIRGELYWIDLPFK